MSCSLELSMKKLGALCTSSLKTLRYLTHSALMASNALFGFLLFSLCVIY